MQAWEEKYYDREEARNEGVSFGREVKLVEQVCKKLKKNLLVSDIAEMLEEDETMIQTICDAAQPFAPDYDIDSIMDVLRGKLE